MKTILEVVAVLAMIVFLIVVAGIISGKTSAYSDTIVKCPECNY